MLPSPAPESRPRRARRASDRRAHRRYTPARQITCQVRLQPDYPPQRGVVHDLSVRGLAVIIRQGVDPGTLLCVWLFNDAATFSLEATLRVTRCYSLAGGDYLVAGQLVQPLSPGEMGPFL